MSKVKKMDLSISEEDLAPSCPLIAEHDILTKIGNTPLIRIKNLCKDLKDVEIYAKAEWRNAGGSVKSRPALRMIEDGEKSGDPITLVKEGRDGEEVDLPNWAHVFTIINMLEKSTIQAIEVR